MNRPDHAPEPSMEEILASIRNIISDDDRKGPHAGGLAHPPRMTAADQSNLPLLEDDVLDLTDELVFAVEQGPSSSHVPENANPAPKVETPSAELPAQRAPSVPPPAEVAQPADIAKDVKGSDGPRGTRPETRPAVGARPIWSRRELPNPAARISPAPERPRRDQPAARTVQKTRIDDIQMPIPSDGPVPLVSPRSDAQPQEPLKPQKRVPETPAARADQPPASSFSGMEEAKVAALAEKLARTAAGAMDEKELTQAHQVDFKQLNEERKTEVAEKFANAIERESTSEAPLPSLLDEVLRQEFLRESASFSEPPDEAMEPHPAQTLEPEQPPEIAPLGDLSQSLDMPNRRTSPSAAPAANAQLKAAAIANQQASDAKRPQQPAAQAQFVGASQSVLASQGGALEEAVREMLRPLLVQWLNEHMPRILEAAIREEIATRGVFPKLPE